MSRVIRYLSLKGADFYTETMIPADGLHVEWVDDEAVVLDESGDRLHYLNSAAAVFFALVQEFGYESALDRMRERFGPALFEDGSIEALVEDMKDRGLLIDG